MIPDADIAALAALNVEMGQREAQLDVQFFEALLAPAFVMRRANEARDLVGREAFLRALAGAARRERVTRVESVELVGQERAVVRCVVTMEGRGYHNLRMFVRAGARGEEGQPGWLLLAWLNEPLPSSTG